MLAFRVPVRIATFEGEMIHDADFPSRPADASVTPPNSERAKPGPASHAGESREQTGMLPGSVRDSDAGIDVDAQDGAWEDSMFESLDRALSVRPPVRARAESLTPLIAVPACPHCLSHRVRRSRTRGWDWPIRWLTLTRDRKSTRLNSSHSSISYAVFCLKKKKKKK